MAQLRREEGRARAMGGEIVVVGNGGPQFIAAFREEIGFAGRIVTDPPLGAYRLLEMKRSLMLSPMTLLRAAEAMTKGFRQTRTQGSAAQLGGVLVVTPAGEVPYRFLSKHAGDHPPVHLVMRALAAALSPPAA